MRRRQVGEALDLERDREAALRGQLEETAAELEGPGIDEETFAAMDPADVTKVGKARVALVTVVFVEPPLELLVSGSAVVRRGRDDAVVRAALDATNRRVSRLEAGTPH